MNSSEHTSESAEIDEAGTPSPPPRVAPWKLTLLLLCVSGVVTAVFFLGWLPKVEQHKVLAEEADQRANAVPQVRIINPETADTSIEVLLPGEIQAEEETVIFPRTSGYLKEWHVDIGDVVTKGQLLAEIDTPEVDQQLQEAMATVEQLKARRQVAETQLELARFTLGRLERLIAANAASQQEYDERKAELAVAKHQVQVAEADIAAGMADLQRIKELQSFTKVYAPFDGTISERSIDLGQLVTSGNDQAQSLFRLLRTDRVRVIIHVPQLYASSIRNGDNAHLVVREMPNRTFAGHISRTAKAIDLQTRTMRVEVELKNTDGMLLPGSYVQVKLPVQRTDPPLIVPASALIFNADGAQLAVVNSQDVIELRHVVVEADQGGKLGIATGISASDRVVVNPGERLSNGLSVSIVEGIRNES